MRKPILSPAEAAAYIEDNATLVVEGSGGGLLEPDLLLRSLRERFLDTSRPRDLTLIHCTGIGNKDFLAVSYKSGNDTGLALYGADGGNWTGIWTYSGGKQVGPEVWKRN